LSKEKSKITAGLITLFIKLSPKCLGVLGKMFKVLKSSKILFATASFGAWSAVFNWKFALMLMGSIFLHELGHIRAMKAYGMKTKGVYFIPFLGAAAVTEESFPTRKAESVIALWGPIWGFILAMIFFDLYLWTGWPMVAAIAAWIAMVNLFNLLPINPLDGGRIVKSLAFSLSNTTGLLVLCLGFVFAFLLSMKFGLSLIVLLLIIGFMETMFEFLSVTEQNYQKVLLENLSKLFDVEPDSEKILQRIGEVMIGIAEQGRIAIPEKILIRAPTILTEKDPYTLTCDFVRILHLLLIISISKKNKYSCWDDGHILLPPEGMTWDDMPQEQPLFSRNKRYYYHLGACMLNDCLTIQQRALYWLSFPIKEMQIGFFRETIIYIIQNSTLAKTLKAKHGKPGMKGWEMLLIGIIYLVLAIALLVIMSVCSIDPASSVAFQVFTN